jgi:hypothetical protein
MNRQEVGMAVPLTWPVPLARATSAHICVVHGPVVEAMTHMVVDERLDGYFYSSFLVAMPQRRNA